MSTELREDPNDATGAAIPWATLSGLTEVPGEWGTIQAVWDGFYARSTVFTIDVGESSAKIERALTLTRERHRDQFRSGRACLRARRLTVGRQ